MAAGRISSRNRRVLLGILLLGFIVASLFYRETIHDATSQLVSFPLPPVDFTETYVTFQEHDTNVIPTVETGLLEVTSAFPTATSTPIHETSPETTQIVNNHVSYPRLKPLEREELDGLRTEHLKIVDEVITGEIENFRAYNVKQLEGLKNYWEKVGRDGNNEQPKVVLSTYGYVPCAMTVCSTTGEVVWLESLMNSFKDNNQFLLYVEYENLGKMYKKLGDVVTHVWSTDEHVVWCFNDTASCIESPENPSGVPPWKLFTFTFWGSPQGWGNFFAPHEPWSYNPLGGEWNLVPYRMPDNHFYLGYHYTGCKSLDYIQPADRKNQVVVLAKRSEYFYRDVFLEASIWPELKKRTGLELISVADSEEGFPVPEDLTLLGPLERHEFDLMLGSSKALLGIGRPRISPSPFASLCRGVPVIVSYKGKKCPARPGDSNWCGFLHDHHQHGVAADIGPPYVYAVDSQGRIEDIVDTVMTAVNTPIEPYIPPDMTKEALTRRIRDYFSIDWKTYASERMRKNGWTRVETQSFMYRWLEKHPVRPQKEVAKTVI